MLFLTLNGCGLGQQEIIELYNVTFNFINDTPERILIFGGCGFDAQSIDTELYVNPRDTLVVRQTEREIMRGDKPTTVDDFDLFFGSCFAIFGDSLKCDFGGFNGIRGIDNYEERIGHSSKDFELTYRFTEQTMEEAVSCEL